MPSMRDDAKSVLGRIVRRLRESSDLSQEKLADRAGITYQYLSAVENGKENFTVGILEAIARALGIALPALVEQAYHCDAQALVVQPEFFLPQAKLPPRLLLSHVAATLNETHKVIGLVNATLKQVSGRPLSSYIQGNNFSGIVSNILCDAFSRLTPYKHNHDQRYPDLVCRMDNRRRQTGLEVKTTIRPGKGGESHNGHSGWHLVACFSLDKESGNIRFVHVMFADLIGQGKPRADWKYVGSQVNQETGSQRTETYVTTGVGTAKLRHGSVYLDTDRVNIKRWRTSKEIKAPIYSPFRKLEG